jgi:hypothetical protein
MVIGREGTEGSYHYFLYRMSRASQAVSAVDGREQRRGARIGWYLSRRAARVQNERLEVQPKQARGRSALCLT